MNGVIYHLSGSGHLGRLRLSIWTLRRFYDGPITVFCPEEDAAAVKRWCGHRNVVTEQINHPSSNRMGGVDDSFKPLLTKPASAMLSKFDVTVYLDTDTIVCQPIDELFQYKLAFTPLWNMEDNRFLMVNDRISKASRRRHAIARIGHTLPSLNPWVLDCIDSDTYCVNTGMFVFAKHHHMIMEWALACMLVRDSFVDDEPCWSLVAMNWMDDIVPLRPEWNTLHYFTVEFAARKIRHLTGVRWERSGECRQLWRRMLNEDIEQGIM